MAPQGQRCAVRGRPGPAPWVLRFAEAWRAASARISAALMGLPQWGHFTLRLPQSFSQFGLRCPNSVHRVTKALPRILRSGLRRLPCFTLLSQLRHHAGGALHLGAILEGGLFVFHKLNIKHLLFIVKDYFNGFPPENGTACDTPEPAGSNGSGAAREMYHHDA